MFGRLSLAVANVLSEIVYYHEKKLFFFVRLSLS